MKRVTGIGGIFFKANNPKLMNEWYGKHLGLQPESDGAPVLLVWRELDHPDQIGRTVWAVFDKDTKYFEPSSAPFMINYRVDNLDRLLENLRAEGVQIDPKREDSEYGRFAWITDPEGNRIELWEPPKE
ncbi:MAG TPA: VOC family protein [Bryobacteraceae bacterium]|nr:VOC family protein [Bryobacteraceae bacterium]